MTSLSRQLLFDYMFGFSFYKLVVLAVILLIVVYGFKFFARTGTPQRVSKDDSAASSRIDTVYDPETDSYVAKGTSERVDKK